MNWIGPKRRHGDSSKGQLPRSELNLTEYQSKDRYEADHPNDRPMGSIQRSRQMTAAMSPLQLRLLATSLTASASEPHADPLRHCEFFRAFGGDRTAIARTFWTKLRAVNVATQ